MPLLAAQSAVHVPAIGEPKGPPVLLLHGLGMGGWMWARTQAVLAARGLASWAIDLPGHGDHADQDPRLDDVLDACTAAAEALGGEILVVGHSFSGLVATVLASRLPLKGAALISPLPVAPVKVLPTPPMARVSMSQLPTVLLGRRMVLGERSRGLIGLNALAPEDAARVGAMPGALVRDLLLRRPVVTRDQLRCPLLITHGFLDPVQRLWTSKLLADHLDAVIWRFDDVGHYAPLEPAGARVLDAMAGWLLRPKGRKIVEIDPLAPHQGVGADVREQRRPLKSRSNSRFGERLVKRGR
ncbi:alpha/beta hydrolase [Myxococcota bacterium]|nr:alpha/beta hydrolase [Myxococcota bacterium]